MCVAIPRPHYDYTIDNRLRRQRGSGRRQCSARLEVGTLAPVPNRVRHPNHGHPPAVLCFSTVDNIQVTSNVHLMVRQVYLIGCVIFWYFLVLLVGKYHFIQDYTKKCPFRVKHRYRMETHCITDFPL